MDWLAQVGRGLAGAGGSWIGWRGWVVDWPAQWWVVDWPALPGGNLYSAVTGVSPQLLREYRHLARVNPETKRDVRYETAIAACFFGVDTCQRRIMPDVTLVDTCQRRAVRYVFAAALFLAASIKRLISSGRSRPGWGVACCSRSAWRAAACLAR